MSATRELRFLVRWNWERDDGDHTAEQVVETKTPYLAYHMATVDLNPRALDGTMIPSDAQIISVATHMCVAGVCQKCAAVIFDHDPRSINRQKQLVCEPCR